MTYQVTIDDYIGRWGFSRQYMRQVLAQFKGKHIDMRISSYGGDLGDGLDIRQQLIDHGDVTVYLTGFVACSHCHRYGCLAYMYEQICHVPCA